MRSTLYCLFFIAAVAIASGCSSADATTSTAIPVATPNPNAQTAKLETAVFAGGCFWGVEGVYEHVKGVTNVVSGYAG
ncbi:MAG: peptide-methionine (S)-S-oxide reductase, partial [Acidobacteria bacterium]|nr:peptide-methionine (S)-S-oxide reductase [Acidobacteriota bacterium]